MDHYYIFRRHANQVAFKMHISPSEAMNIMEPLPFGFDWSEIVFIEERLVKELRDAEAPDMDKETTNEFIYIFKTLLKCLSTNEIIVLDGSSSLQGLTIFNRFAFNDQMKEYFISTWKKYLSSRIVKEEKYPFDAEKSFEEGFNKVPILEDVPALSFNVVDMVKEKIKQLSDPQNEETLKQETPKEETPKEETPKEETPKEETPKEETPKEISVKQEIVQSVILTSSSESVEEISIPKDNWMILGEDASEYKFRDCFLRIASNDLQLFSEKRQEMYDDYVGYIPQLTTKKLIDSKYSGDQQKCNMEFTATFMKYNSSWDNPVLYPEFSDKYPQYKEIVNSIGPHHIVFVDEKITLEEKGSPKLKGGRLYEEYGLYITRKQKQFAKDVIQFHESYEQKVKDSYKNKRFWSWLNIDDFSNSVSLYKDEALFITSACEQKLENAKKLLPKRKIPTYEGKFNVNIKNVFDKIFSSEKGKHYCITEKKYKDGDTEYAWSSSDPRLNARSEQINFVLYKEFISRSN